MNVDKIIKKLRNLPQYKNMSEEELNLIAKEKAEKEEIINSLTFCLPEEKQLAQTKLEEYLKQGQIETPSDKSTLMLLIDNEIAIERIKKIITKNFDKENPYIPVELAKEKNDLISQNLTLKDKLGLNKKAGEENSVVKTIEDLKSRFKKWINQPENRSNYTFACFHCGKTFLIRRRIDKDKDEVREHPWYVNGGILMNKQIFKDLKENKITIDQATRYLNCSPDYIQWLQNNYNIDEDNV
ncbi:MAG: hypothetical protein WC169_11975 [Dehalococcoidia bacterium]|jgi:hypothetical protein